MCYTKREELSKWLDKVLLVFYFLGSPCATRKRNEIKSFKCYNSSKIILLFFLITVKETIVGLNSKIQPLDLSMLGSLKKVKDSQLEANCW